MPMAIPRKLLKKTAQRIAKERPTRKRTEELPDFDEAQRPKAVIKDIGDAIQEFKDYAGEKAPSAQDSERMSKMKAEYEAGLKPGALPTAGNSVSQTKSIDFGSVQAKQQIQIPQRSGAMPVGKPMMAAMGAGIAARKTEQGEALDVGGRMRNIPIKAHKIPTQYIKTMPSTWEPPRFDEIDSLYPLIKPFSMANLKWNAEKNHLEYYVLEPYLTKEQERQLRTIKELVVDLLDVNLFEVKEAKSIRTVLKNKINKVIADYGIQLSKDEYAKILYFIYRDFLGLSTIEPLMHDPNIEDVSCDGVDIPLYIYHRKYASVPTNIKFPNDDNLNQFITKLAQRCGKHISVAEPLLDGALPDGSRVQATYSSHKDIAMHGSTFTIRKFTRDPLTITDLIKFGTIPEMMAAYLWLAIEYKRSILVAGGTATGKTSSLNALSMFLPSEAKIVSIEDTPEIRLPHEHWIQKVVRTGFGREDMTGRKQGEITMYDLLRAALRERPDELIVGEVRGKEAYVLFQGMASVRGNERVLVVDGNGFTQNIEIKKLSGKDLTGYKAPTINLQTKKAELVPLTGCVEHKPRKELHEIRTLTGRRVQTTGDHSVFTWHNGSIKPIPVKDLKPGSKIIVPASLPGGYADKQFLDLTKLLPGLRVLAPEYIKKASRILGWEKAGKAAGVATISDYYGIKPSALKLNAYKKLLKAAGISNSPANILVRFDRRSKSSRPQLELTPELLRLMGYHVSEGSLNTANGTLALYNSDPEVLNDMRHCIKAVAGSSPRERACTGGWGTCTELVYNHQTISKFFKKYCYEGKAKRVPSFVFGLSAQKVGQFLGALYTGDGSIRRKCFQYTTKSGVLADDLTKLLLELGIHAHIYEKEGLYRIEFARKKAQEKFMGLAPLIGKKCELAPKGLRNPRVKEDTYIDIVKSVEKIKLKEAEPVYDLCVPGTQNFIGGLGGVMLHNTGHAGMATIHGDSVDAVMHRLQTPPINLSAGLLQHLNIVLVLTKARVKGIEVRRVKEVVEILGLTKEQEPIINTLFRWNPSDDTFEFSSDKSYILQGIIEDKGIDEKSVWEEVQRRTRIMRWMKNNDIRYYVDVGKVIQQYYKNPQEVLKNI